MHHLYISIHNNAVALQKEREALVAWCVENGVSEYDFIEDNLTIGRIPDKRVRKLLNPIRQGDTIVVSEISRLGRSLGMLQIVMNRLRDNECTLVTLDGRIMEPNRTMSLFVNHLNDIVEIERKIKAFRSSDVIYAKREEGASIGRPLGAKKKPEKNVLFGKEDELLRLHSLGYKPRMIAEVIGVSRSTVANYLKASENKPE